MGTGVASNALCFGDMQAPMSDTSEDWKTVTSKRRLVQLRHCLLREVEMDLTISVTDVLLGRKLACFRGACCIASHKLLSDICIARTLRQPGPINPQNSDSLGVHVLGHHWTKGMI